MVHDLVLRMKSDLAQFKFITRPTLFALERALSFDEAVLYAVLHEAIYCENEASNWAAEHVGKSIKEFSWLAGSPQSALAVREAPLFFSGEMIYPFMFDIFPELEKLAPVADLLAKHTDWPDLYDPWQASHNCFLLRPCNLLIMYISWPKMRCPFTQLPSSMTCM